ncbi:hypothetical protein IM538_13535 [Cytobacillus suaedae]|uniref:NADH dehydrogenase subunit 6 n=1 Tax=Litchfieldia luteola TaxID=682179 RepID=A0ABR9QMY0_9BACI|nr:hypothetical protein [Cytobacillus luteolus]MBE4909862.1 hypothetical protein [Cytobacillus luteolus]MBP1942588.1 IS4 transposase [Cytobacillus luteolus]QOR64871.1 hypothetical protein IM538_13535 [Cytobacillus suaedae]
MRRNKNVDLVIFLLFCLLIMLIVHVILHVKVFVVYSASLGSIFMIGLIIFLIVLLYLKA